MLLSLNSLNLLRVNFSTKFSSVTTFQLSLVIELKFSMTHWRTSSRSFLSWGEEALRGVRRGVLGVWGEVLEAGLGVLGARKEDSDLGLGVVEALGASEEVLWAGLGVSTVVVVWDVDLEIDVVAGILGVL